MPDLAVHTWGPTDGPTVCFWHPLGIAPSGLYARDLGEHLATLGYRTIAPDGPGHGQSPLLEPGDYAVDALVGRALALWGGDAVWVGHSWGGTIGLRAAAAQPDRIRGLVLLDVGYADVRTPAPADLDEARRLQSERMAEWRWPSWEPFVAELREAVHGELRPTFLETLRAGLRDDDGALVPVAGVEARARAFFNMFAAPPSASYPALAQSGIPVLLLLATEPRDQGAERAAAVERFLAAVPQAEVVRMAGCGHDLIADAGLDVARIVGEWLQRWSSLSH